MACNLLNEYAPIPNLERGKSYHLGADTKDSNRVVYTSGQLVVLRNIQTPINCFIYKEHKHPTTCARMSPSGYYISSSDASKKILVWDTVGSDHCIKLEKMSVGGVTDMAWSPDSKRIVVAGSGSGGIHGDAFMLDGGASVGTLTGHAKPMLSIDYKPDRPFRLATGSEDGKLCFFEGPPFKNPNASSAHQRFVTCVRFSPNNELLVSVGTDKKIVFYKASDCSVVKEIANAHNGGIYGVSWSRDSQFILTASSDKTCKKWNTQGECVTTFQLDSGRAELDQQLGCLWNGDNMLSISLGGDISVLDDFNPTKPSNVIQGHCVFIEALAYDSGSDKFFSGDRDGKIVCWDRGTAKNTPFFGGKHASKIVDLCLDDGNLYSVSLDDTVRTTPLDSLTYSPGVKLPSQPNGLAKTGGFVFVSCKEHIVTLQKGQIVQTLAAKWGPTCISANADFVAVGGADKNLYVYHNQDGVLKESHKVTHAAPLASCEVSADGALVAGGDSSKNYVIWNKIEKLHYGAMSARVDCMKFSPNSQFLAVGSLDSSFALFSLAKNGQAHEQRVAHVGGVKDLLWVDQRTLMTTGQDCVTRTWNINL